MTAYFADLDRLLDPLIGFLTQAYVPWLLTLGIVAWTLCIWLVFRTIRLGPAFRALRQAVNIIREAKDATEFAEKFESVSERIDQIRVVGPVWSKFTKELLLPDQQGERIKTPVKASALFNPDLLLHQAGINMRFFQAMPNYLVGVGLLCTFLGLFAALHVAAQALNAENPAKMAVTLQTLLQTASFKFLTSLAGLLCSLVFSWRLRGQLHRWTNQVRSFCRELDDRVDFITQEHLARDSVSELRKQTEQLQRFNTDLSIAVSEGLNRSVPALLSPLQNALTSLSEKMASVDQDAIQDMARTFYEKLQGGTEGQFGKLVETLENVQRSLDSTMERMTAEVVGAGKKFSGEMASAATSFDSVIGQAAATLHQTFASLGPNLEKMERMAGDLEARIRCQLEEFDASIAALKRSIELARGLGEEFERVGAPITSAGDRLGKVTEQLEMIAGKVTEIECPFVGSDD
jgi:hypothetical protein